jgi:hypothetical protein
MPNPPAWLKDGSRYYTQIGGEAADPVTVFDVADNEEASSEKPGTACLYLEPHFRLVRVRDVDGREQGIAGR